MGFGKAPLYFLLLSAILSGTLFYCAKLPSEPNYTEYGSIKISAMISEKLRKVSAAAATTYEILVMEVFGNNMDTLRFSRKKTENSNTFIDTFSGIPAGEMREVKIYTTDNKGLIVHIDSLNSQIVRIEKNRITPFNATLIPVAGSIYMQLANVPTDIDSLFLIFISSKGTTWEKRLKRSFKMNMNLDNIPDGTEGTIYFTAINQRGDTLYHASKWIRFNARELSKLVFDFDLFPGSVAMDIEVKSAGVTLITINMADLTNSEESGELIITKIMYNAPDSLKYIEIYNPSEEAISFDTLIIEVDRSRKRIDSVNIDAKGFYILGRKENARTNKLLQLDLTKNGSLITLRSKDLTIIDRVIFIGMSNALEWPVAAYNEAIYLDTASYNVTKNNFGRNWYTATDPIP